MEYLVLARKWRPQNFEDVVGQDHVVKTLKNAIRHGRIAHAFIFSGPRGVGKTSVARILAKSLNCENGPTEGPCNHCVNCREIAQSISLDVQEIDGASNRGIDEVRELRENIKFSPLSSHYKVYIIDEVHMLTKEAFNALLKTLEEPPPHVIFIFATTEIYKIPATILSRCQHFNFKRVSIRGIAANLRKIANAEGITISEKGLTWVAQAGQGSMRDAEGVFDQVISFAGMEIKDSDVEDFLGIADRRFLYDLSSAVLQGDAGACLKIIEEAYYSGIDVKQFFEMLLTHFMNLWIVKIAGSDNALVDLPDHELSEINKCAEGTSREILQRCVDILMAEEADIRRSPDSLTSLEYLLVKMAHVEPVIPIDEVISRMEGLEERLSLPSDISETGRNILEKEDSDFSDKAVVAESKTIDMPEDMIAEETLSGDVIWENFKNFVKNKNILLWNKIEPGAVLGYLDKCLRIGFQEGYIFWEDITKSPQKEVLDRASREFFRNDVELKIEMVDAGGVEQKKAVANAKDHVEEDIKSKALNHPLVQKVLDVFEGAEVRDVKVK